MNEPKLIRYKEDEIILQQGSTKKELYKILAGKVENEQLAGILRRYTRFGPDGSPLSAIQV